jgi:4-aminobutyrate aminotransferase/(S)-3-amino-2-methylpropionate transaminase
LIIYIAGEVRGKGFMLACELVKDKATKEAIAAQKSFAIMIKLRNKGVLKFICGRYGNFFRFMPPLVTPKAYFEKAIDIFLNILREDEKDLMR